MAESSPSDAIPSAGSTECQKRKVRLFCSGSRVVSRIVGAIPAHPLALGAVFLFVLSVSGGRMSWGFPDTAAGEAGLGGEDVDVYIVDEGGVIADEADDALITSTGIATDHRDGDGGAELGSSSPATDGLVTVPWSPVMPSGAGGRSVTVYTVRSGDTLSSIAAAFGVSVRAIAWSNNVVDPDSIQPGDMLRIPPVPGVLHIVKNGETISGIAKRYAAEEGAIIAFNGLPADGSLRAGDELVVPGGTPPSPTAPKPSPRPAAPRAPQFATSQVPFGYWIAPTTGRNYGRRHSNNGVDIANKCGTPVYAAAAGTITRADGSGWNGGYGIVIEIAHPNGTSTRYAHLSQIIAWGGQVAQGQLIGLMGTTGRSTGCHLHFEVHGARNPLVR